MKNLITREMYKKIKRMDHMKLEDFCKRLCQSAYNDGIRDANKDVISNEELETAISAIKGIGEKKLSEIMEAIRSVQRNEIPKDKEAR